MLDQAAQPKVRQGLQALQRAVQQVVSVHLLASHQNWLFTQRRPILAI
jgi:hypothetical protein